jgi:hypothetical protein
MKDKITNGIIMKEDMNYIGELGGCRRERRNWPGPGKCPGLAVRKRQALYL